MLKPGGDDDRAALDGVGPVGSGHLQLECARLTGKRGRRGLQPHLDEWLAGDPVGHAAHHGLCGLAVRGDARVVRVDRHAAEDLGPLEQHDRGTDLGDTLRCAQSARSPADDDNCVE